MTAERETLYPFRAELQMTFAAKSLDDAARLFEEIEEAVERWAFVEGGSVGQMADADVIPDSPLAEALGRE